MSQNNTHKNASSDWKSKFHEVLSSCQVELKKTTQIGIKMLSASQSNAQLHETYESLGVLVREAIRKGELKWSNQAVNDLMDKIDVLEAQMESFEVEVQNIKNAPSFEPEKSP